MATDVDLKMGEERVLFHYTHSSAIDQWATVELKLSRLVVRQDDQSVSEGLRNAFLGMESFRAKLEFADRYVLLRFEGNGSVLDRWTALKDDLRRENQTRNKLAHWTSREHGKAEPGRRYVLVPPAVPPSSKMAREAPRDQHEDPPPGYAMGTLDIAYWQARLGHLINRLNDLYEDPQGNGGAHRVREVVERPRLEALVKRFRTVLQL